MLLQWGAILHCQKSMPCIVSEKNRNTKRTKVTHDAYYVAAAVGEGMFQDEVSSSSEEIKPVALSIVELRHLVSQ